ncbi:hypothetical protein HYH03_017788 [Edaphochlamys debaryana]|uniref:Uncharacterized protein n=1 Tax=Edaphochlamys debaryana TaxID=47281 RepID=A0A836BNT6_9CHLO|nr:hypothetical protein HYH03_017788 [Edaphochlamys debaryana]|eukprot:KAG2483340.1 hypothetical protein HYH03_017788 [Edaphochlamys debaryana]
MAPNTLPHADTDALMPPPPSRRTSIDLIRRRHLGGASSCKSLLSTCTTAPLFQPTSPIEDAAHDAAPYRFGRSGSGLGSGSSSPDLLDTQELDAEAVATLPPQGLNRILGAVGRDELEEQRLLLESFNWEYESVLMEEVLLGMRMGEGGR